MGRVMGAALGAIAALMPGAAWAQAAAVSSPQFDVAAATQAYLALLAGPARAKSDAYFEGGYWLPLWSTLVALAVYWLLLKTGWSARLRGWAERVTTKRWLQPALYALPFVVITALMMLPWGIYADFVREGQYGLMNQSFGAWFVDWAKATAINLVLTPLMFMALFAAIRALPRGWWLLGAGLMTMFVAFGALIAPVFIAPLFNSYTEMQQGPLRDRIVAIAAQNHIPAEHIYVSDASRQSKRISANVSGLGPTIRITLNDNLLNRTSPEEVQAVMGHEMGHYVLNHIRNLIIGFGIVFAVIFFAVSQAAPALIRRNPGWSVRDVADPAAAPVLLGLAAVAGLVLTPIQNTLIRTNEVAADRFGLDAARQPDGFAKIAMRLSEYRKISAGPLEEFLFYDHPTGENRVRMAMEWKKAHVPDAAMVHPTPIDVK